jgi:polyketide cyclase/dehydrase/lipid transport protein
MIGQSGVRMLGASGARTIGSAALAACFVLLAVVASSAQTPPTATAPPAQPPLTAAAPPTPNANIVVENPTYISIAMEVTVDRPAADVWKRVGGYCAIGEWFQMANGCKILAGTDNEIGAVRSVANEVLVGKTPLSYTYTQPVRAGRPYTLYHGTLEARPLTPTTTKLLYTLVYDNSTLPDDAAREKDKASRTATFTRALNNMKILAEGGTLPPR